MAFSYEDFMSAAKQAGMLEQFSPYDLDLAKKYPNFGLSLLSYKQDYAKATTQEAKELANTAANRLRSSYGNYTGGTDGMDYIAGDLAPSGYSSPYEQQISDILNRMNGFGNFSYDRSAPTYSSEYSAQQKALLDEILNRPDFSYDHNEDPNWSAYKKQYLREGERATANALAQAAAASGGIPSSYAQTAASQAGDYYAGQLSDKIPELNEQAYRRYLDENSMKRADLSAVNSLEQIAYGRHLDSMGQYNSDRAQTYEEFMDKYKMLTDSLSANREQDTTEYQRLLDQIKYNQNADKGAENAQAEARAIVDDILAAGGTPSAQLVAQSGYPQEYIEAMGAYYAAHAK